MQISVITCTLNSILTLRHTTESIRSQSYRDIDHIFVDGGSTDGTLEYINNLACPKQILYNVSGGIAKAMNAGAEVARGEVLCHLHSDDYFLHARVLERIAEKFQRTNANWVFGRILSDINGALMPEPFLVPDYSYARLLRGNFIPHPATFIRTSVFNALGGFRDDLRFAMDYEFFLRLGLKHEPLALREALAVFRRHEGSTTQNNRLASFEEDHRVRLEYASRRPWERAMHAARYWVRKRRLVALLDRASDAD